MKFGTLVAALREDIPLTQPQLAENTGLPLRVVQEIEQGRRLDLHKGNALIKLAAGLQLTTLERQQFLFAASGVSEQDFLREGNGLTSTNFNTDEIIEDLKRVITGMRFPAFITDSYCDVLFANKLIMEFLRIPPKLIADAKNPKIADGRNMMRILFHPESTYPSLIGKDWERHALLNIRFFRRTSLRYRGNQYFSELKSALDKYDAFRLYWKRTLAEVNDEFLSYATYKLKISDKLTLEYFGTEIFLGITPYGELYMNMYMPLEDTTAKMFDEMYQNIGASCEQFSPFPDKNKWKPRNEKK